MIIFAPSYPLRGYFVQLNFFLCGLMKKPVVVLTALLLSCSLAFSQEADDTVSGVGFSLIPRLDFSPVFPAESAKDLTLGNSSIYSLFEGSFLDERLTFSIENHWLSASPADLYVCEDEDGKRSANIFRSDNVNWLDWAYLSYTVAGFNFTVGKDCMMICGFEYDDYDFNVHPAIMSSVWNNFSPYQWGAKVGYTTPSENHEFAFQACASPYGERPFASKLFAYSFAWNGTFGAYSTRLTATALQTDVKSFVPMISFGQKYEFDGGYACLDLFNCVETSDYETSVWGITAMPSVCYSPIESVELFAKGGFEYDFNAESRKGGFFGGAGVHWYPLQDKSLRIHLLAAINHTPYSALANWDGVVRNYTVSIGAIYYLNFGILK